MFFNGDVAFHHMLLCIHFDKISSFLFFNYFSLNGDLFAVYWLMISFIIIVIIVTSVEAYYILSFVFDTMLWMYSIRVLFLFVLSQNLIVSSFSVFLYISFILQACIYTCPFILGYNFLLGAFINMILSRYKILTLYH